MKKILLSLFCVLACCACDAQHSLTFKLSDVGNDSVTISVIDKTFRALESNNTIAAKNGEFTYDLQGDKARMVMVSFPSKPGSGRLSVWAVPGEQGVLTGTLDHAEWSGTTFYTELASLEKITDPIGEDISKLSKEFQDGIKAGKSQDEMQKEIMPKYAELSKKIADANMNFIKANPKSLVCMSLVMESEDPEATLSLIAPEVKNGCFSDVTAAVEAQIAEKKAQEEAAKKVAPGCVAPDFTLKDINGKDLALSSLRGKYVVLDFWGSWCGWCIKGFPEMKEYYKKYAGKFEILGVDCNDTEEKWKAAVEKNELPWKLVFCPRDNRALLSDYAIQGFPTKIIIDPEGKIYKTVVGEDPAFYTELDNLFGNK